MTPTRVLTLVMVLLTAPIASADPPVPSVKEVTKRLDDLYRASSSSGRMTMKIVTKHYSRTLEMEMWSKGTKYMLAVIRKPARSAGTATLKTKEGMWNYVVRADQLIRIPPGLLGDGWMGSHFTNDDVMRENTYEEEYDTVADWAELDGTKRLRLTMVPKENAPVPYRKLEFYLTADEYLPVQAVYWDAKKVVRNEYFRDIQEHNGRKFPSVIQVIPSDKPDESTTVIYDTLKFNVPVDDGLFTPRGLRKAAHQR